MCVFIAFLCVIWVLLSGEEIQTSKRKAKEEVCVYVSVDNEEEEEVQTEKVFGDFHVCVCMCTLVCVRACVREVSLETQNLPNITAI